MFIAHSTKEEVINDEIELIYTVKIIIDGEKYIYKSITPISDKEVKRKIRTLENEIKFKGMIE